MVFVWFRMPQDVTEPPLRTVAALTTIFSDWSAVNGVADESETFTVKVVEPDALGDPVMLPEEDRVRPFGNCPEEIVHVYGGVPPVAARTAK